ncbi:unnamed protein product [Rotaria sp. Silwood2]|nr:unnamed protein product [Rotaria sp. Silwood2]CAF2891483.1 unnamed protein product [Rotaria sp. Silwood2]CAF3369302.1 unnamed protein product [Rotaria sp. Silwood2]CAF3925303.1 unnamed protein product [Rotaria sp. Silwood2]CAF4279579.1 unnamed protein product [Rotaria sp. Silwood2]
MDTTFELCRDLTTLAMHLNSSGFLFFYHNALIDSIYLELADLEEKLTNEQLEYLRQCEYIYSIVILVNIPLSNLVYTMKKYPTRNELQAIAKQWNIDDWEFYHDLDDWFFSRRLAEQVVVLRSYEARTSAA